MARMQMAEYEQVARETKVKDGRHRAPEPPLVAQHGCTENQTASASSPRNTPAIARRRLPDLRFGFTVSRARHAMR